MRRLYRSRRDALVDALQRHLGDDIVIHGSSAGIHLSFRFVDPRLVDTEIAAAAMARGVVARALSAHASGLRKNGWNGLILGYAQVDVAHMDAAVKTLAAVIAAAGRD
jgi:GntR family transcriptional regulator/MocR family aminotransferase